MCPRCGAKVKTAAFVCAIASALATAVCAVMRGSHRDFPKIHPREPQPSSSRVQANGLAKPRQVAQLPWKFFAFFRVKVPGAVLLVSTVTFFGFVMIDEEPSLDKQIA